MQRPIAKPIKRSVTRLIAQPIARAIPSLAMDFARQQYIMGGVGTQPTYRDFDDLITFTRASGGGRFNAAGQYEWLPANQPRIDYDPVTGECLGLLIEESRTNLLTHSSDFANAVWGIVQATITHGYPAPDGSFSKSLLIPSTVYAEHRLSRVMPLTVGTNYAYSVFVERHENAPYANIRIGIAGTPHSLTCIFDLETGESWVAVGALEAPTLIKQETQRYGTGFFLTVVFSPKTTNNYYIQTGVTWNAYNFLSSGDGTSGIYIWGAQLEAGSSPTSYIPTTSAQVTRSADAASVNVLSPWYRADEGTLFVEVVPGQTTTANWATTLSNSDTNLSNLIDLGWGPPGQQSPRGRVINVGTTQAQQFIGPAVISGQPIKMSIAYAADSVQAAANGAVSAKDTSATIPSVNRLQIGMVGAFGYSPGHIKSIRYYPRALSSTELQALTA